MVTLAELRCVSVVCVSGRAGIGRPCPAQAQGLRQRFLTGPGAFGDARSTLQTTLTAFWAEVGGRSLAVEDPRGPGNPARTVVGGRYQGGGAPRWKMGGGRGARGGRGCRGFGNGEAAASVSGSGRPALRSGESAASTRPSAKLGWLWCAAKVNWRPDFLVLLAGVVGTGSPPGLLSPHYSSALQAPRLPTEQGSADRSTVREKVSEQKQG